jgi:hypothetical protein
VTRRPFSIAAVVLLLVGSACGKSIAAKTPSRAAIVTAAKVPKLQSGASVFFVGNSFFGHGPAQLDTLVASLGRTVSPAITIHTGAHLVPGNHPLSWFLQQAQSRAAIDSGRYDVFVLQGEEREPVDHVDDFKQAVRDYHKAVTAHGGRVMLFMTWDFIWEKDSTFFAQLSRAYDELGAELGIPVIPAGLIYADANAHRYGTMQPYWLNDVDHLHQNQYGTLVNAYATFAMLTGVNPSGSAIPDYEPQGVTPDLYRYLSDASWARVQPRLGEH